MAHQLAGQRIAILASNDGMEQVEFTSPWEAVTDAGGTPELLSPEPGTARAFNHLDEGDAFPVDAAIADADPSGYDALVVPGGVANPDQLRTVPEAVEFVRAMFRAGAAEHQLPCRYPRVRAGRRRLRPRSCGSAGKLWLRRESAKPGLCTQRGVGRQVSPNID